MLQYDKVGSSVVGVQEVSMEETERYGIVEPRKNQGRLTLLTVL